MRIVWGDLVTLERTLKIKSIETRIIRRSVKQFWILLIKTF